jgi:hypothetical protein
LPECGLSERTQSDIHFDGMNHYWQPCSHIVLLSINDEPKRSCCRSRCRRCCACLSHPTDHWKKLSHDGNRARSLPRHPPGPYSGNKVSIRLGPENNGAYIADSYESRAQNRRANIRRRGDPCDGTDVRDPAWLHRRLWRGHLVGHIVRGRLQSCFGPRSDYCIWFCYGRNYTYRLVATVMGRRVPRNMVGGDISLAASFYSSSGDLDPAGGCQYPWNTNLQVWSGLVSLRMGLPQVLGSPRDRNARNWPGLAKEPTFPHGTARIVRPGACVGGQPGLDGFVSSPIDVARMVLLDQHLPLRPRQLSHAFFGAPDPSSVVSWRVRP